MSRVTHSPNIAASLAPKTPAVLINGRNSISTLPAGAFSRTLTILRSAAQAAAVYLAEYRHSKSAEDIYRRLRSMSDAELAKLGIERRQISEYVKRQVF